MYSRGMFSIAIAVFIFHQIELPRCLPFIKDQVKQRDKLNYQEKWSMHARKVSTRVCYQSTRTSKYCELIIFHGTRAKLFKPRALFIYLSHNTNRHFRSAITPRRSSRIRN